MSSQTEERVLVFDVSARFAHFKRIYATTTALTYPVPMKTTVYGMLGAILGLEREDNAYLEQFPAGACRIGLRVMNPIRTQRMTINLRPDFGGLYLKSSKGNRKPTLMEFVYEPKYRLYVQLANKELYGQLKSQLERGRSVFTPCLGLANLIATIDYRGEGEVVPVGDDTVVSINGIIPKSRLQQLDPAPQPGLRLLESAQYAVEMDPSRDVTVRDAVLLDRNGGAIRATAIDVYQISYSEQSDHVVLF